MKRDDSSTANILILSLWIPILCVVVVVGVFAFPIAVYFFEEHVLGQTADESHADYRVFRISAECNENTNNTDYWFLREDDIYHYSLPDGPLEIVCKGEEEEKRSLNRVDEKYDDPQQASVQANGRVITFEHDYGEKEFYYRLEDGTAQQIKCLQKRRFRLSQLYRKNLTTDDGDVVGLFQVSSTHNSRLYGSHHYLAREVLFCLNPETGENEILYETENNLTRIVGYHNKKIYLVRDYCIYTVDVQTGEEQELCRLWQDERKDSYDYLFDWQGDYLIVQRQDWESCEVYAVGVEK